MELSVNLSLFSLLSLILQIAADHQNVSSIKPQVLKSGAGGSVTIQCPIKPDTNFFSAHWTFGWDPENLNQHQNYRNRTTFTKNNLEMTINNLTEEDSGIYFCHVDDSGCKEEGPGAMLLVTPISEPTGTVVPQERQDCPSTILYLVVGLEGCVILILLAMHVIFWISGSSDQKNKPKNEPEPPREICYVEVRTKTQKNQRPRTNSREEICYAEVCTRTQKNQNPGTKRREETIIYAPIKPRQ